MDNQPPWRPLPPPAPPLAPPPQPPLPPPEERPLRKRFRLSQKWKSRLLTAGRVLGFMVIGAGVTIGVYEIKNHYWPNKPKVSFEEVTIKKTVKLPVKEKRKQILDNRIACRTMGYKRASHTIINQQGQKEDLSSFLRRSMKSKAASDYGDKIIEDSRKNVYLKDLNIKPLDLAVQTMRIAWADITTRASYSKDYEVEEGGTGYDKGGDSRQTLEEFCLPKDKTSKCLGDCDDYATFMLTAYEVIRAKAEAGMKTDGFLKRLAEGLWRYQMVGISRSEHVLLATFTYSSDFRHVEVSPFEPQTYLKDGDEKSFSFGLHGGRFLVWDSTDDKAVKIYEIKTVFNSTDICKPK